MLKQGLPSHPIAERTLSMRSVSSRSVDFFTEYTRTLEYIPDTLVGFLRIRECDLESLGSEEVEETTNALC